MSPRGQYDRSRFKKAALVAANPGVADVSRGTNAPVSSHQAMDEPVSDVDLNNRVIEGDDTPLHPLDLAPANANITVTQDDNRRTAWLSDTRTVSALPASDPASRLPEGAFIQKQAKGVFVAVQLNPAESRPPLVVSSAIEAIDGFLAHFHDVKR